MKAFCSVVDMVNEWVGRVAAWLVIPMCLLVTYDVTLRYIFNQPTIWSWDINVQLLGASAALGGGFTLLHKGHIGVDVLLLRLSPQKQLIVKLLTSLFFFLGVGVLVWQAGLEAWVSAQQLEVDYTYFAPPLYPIKGTIFLGFLLLFLQGIAELIRDITAVLSENR